jgi:hypothetical protein
MKTNFKIIFRNAFTGLKNTKAQVSKVVTKQTQKQNGNFLTRAGYDFVH